MKATNTVIILTYLLIYILTYTNEQELDPIGITLPC
jgi:hypothetical protein